MTSKNESKSISVVKSGNKIQIGLPTLCNYEDDSEEELEQEKNPKLLKPVNDKPKEIDGKMEKPRSGLLGLLPAPKASNNPFIKKNNNNNNNDKTSKPTTSSESNSNQLLLPRSLTNVKPVVKLPMFLNDSDDDEDEVDVKPKATITNENFTKHEKFNNYVDTEEDPDPKFDDDDDEVQEAKTSSASYTESKRALDDEALLRLCGSQGKKQKMDIKLTDVSANEIVGDNKAELMKQITSEYRPPSNKEYFTSSSRRTHHVTYLAKVALERDQELRNTWAQNKFNRKQAKDKYGF